MRSVRSLVLGFAALLLTSTLAFAQGTTTGSLRGFITDDQGTPLPGTTVVAKSDKLVAGRLSTVTGINGSYRFPSLPPGVYSVEASLAGFVTTVQENLRIPLGGEMKLDLVMKMDNQVSETIIVSAQAPVISTVSSARSTNLTVEELDRIPLSRDPLSFMNLTPGVNDNRAFGGTQEATTSFNLDGVNVNNPAAGDHWLLPSPDWIEEIQVGGLGAAAEYGGFTGGMMNIVTKSGGNEFAGDVRAYYSSGSMIAENDTGQSFEEISFSLGGPIIKNKLWFYIAGQETRDDYTPFEAPVPIEKSVHRYLAKLTFQANEKNTLSFLLDYDAIERENRGIGPETTQAASVKQDSPNFSYNVTWDSILSESLYLSAKFTGFDGKDERLPYNGDIAGATNFDYYNVRNAVYTRKYEPSQSTFDVSLTWYVDDLFNKGESHKFKFGVISMDSDYKENRWRNGGYSFYMPQDPVGFDTGNEIHLDATLSEITAYVQDSVTVGNFTINPGVRFTQYKGGFGNAADDVYDVEMVSPRIGIVWDVTGDGVNVLKAHYGRYFEGMFTYLYDREQSGNAFEEAVYWQFYEDYIDDWLGARGVDNWDDYLSMYGDLSEFYNTADLTQAEITGGRVPDQAAIDPNIDHPYADEWLLTYERQLNEDMMIGVDLVKRKFRNIVAMVNLEDDYDELIAYDSEDYNNLGTGNVLADGGFDEPPFYDLLSNQEYLITNPQGAYRDYHSVILRFQKRYSDGWSLRASLVWSNLKGNVYGATGYDAVEYEDWNNAINADGRLPGNDKWEAKIDFSYDLPYDVILSVYYTYRSGQYWTPTARIRGLYKNSRNDEIFLTDRGSMKYPSRNLVDLKLSKRFDLTDRYSLEFMLDVFNLFNSDTTLDYDDRYATYNYYWRNWPDQDDYYGDNMWTKNDGYKDIWAIERPREIRLGVKFRF